MKYFAKSCYILPVLLCAAGATQAQEDEPEPDHLVDQRRGAGEGKQDSQQSQRARGRLE